MRILITIFSFLFVSASWSQQYFYKLYSGNSFDKGEDIIVEINSEAFTQQDYMYVQQLNDIIKENNELGVFELGNLKITVNSLEEQQQKYIRL